MQSLIQPMLLRELDHDADVRGWLCGEKLDGFRCLWDGQQLYSRHGRIFAAPQWLLDGLPDAELDGELWNSRKGGLAAVQGAVWRGDFAGLSFRPFDAPLQPGAFVERLEYVEQVCKGSTAVPVPHEVIRDCSHAWEIAGRFFHLGGEGAVVRNPAGLYQPGKRSSDALKLRPAEILGERRGVRLAA